MGLPDVLELLTISIIIIIWLLFKKTKKKVEKPSSDNASKQSNMKAKFCGECGAPLEENDRFCPVCGTEVVGIK